MKRHGIKPTSTREEVIECMGQGRQSDAWLD
jgi:hypothetical protein